MALRNMTRHTVLTVKTPKKSRSLPPAPPEARLLALASGCGAVQAALGALAPWRRPSESPASSAFGARATPAATYRTAPRAALMTRGTMIVYGNGSSSVAGSDAPLLAAASYEATIPPVTPHSTSVSHVYLNMFNYKTTSLYLFWQMGRVCGLPARAKTSF